MTEKKEILRKLNLEAEIDRLKKQLFSKDQQIRELQREVNDYAIREEQLVAEITRLTALNAQQPAILLTGLQGSGKVAETKEEFLNPKLDNGTGLNRAPQEGLEKDWTEMMLAYTDEIFIAEGTPDTVLLRDDENRWYITPTGRTRLPFPILQSDLNNLNILKIRPATDEEVEDFINQNNL